MQTNHVLLDIDGCLTTRKYESLDLKSLNCIKKLLSKIHCSKSFCTGRSQPYVELMGQILNIKATTNILEHGCILNTTTDSSDFCDINPKITQKILREMRRIRDTLSLSSKCVLEPGKEIALSLNPVTTMEDLKLFVSNIPNIHNFSVKISADSIDISPEGISKGGAILEVFKNPNGILAIGDSEGDRTMLEIVEFPACPANASQGIKELVLSRNGYVSKKYHAQGVLDILLKHFFTQ